MNMRAFSYPFAWSLKQGRISQGYLQTQEFTVRG